MLHGPLLRTSCLAAALVFTGCAASTPGPAATTAPAAAPAGFRAVPIGLCEDYPEESTTDAVLRRDFALVRETGARHLRFAIGWDSTEPEKDEYAFEPWDRVIDLAVEYGIEPIPYVCYTPEWNSTGEGDEVHRAPPRDLAEFEEFMERLARRYRGKVDSWEIWNEPDNRAYFTGDAASYADLLAAGARGVRRGNPEAKVVFGGIAYDLDFLRDAFAIDGVARDADVVNLHDYTETWSYDPAEYIPEYVTLARNIVRELGEDEPLWMAEVGYSTFRRGPFVSEVYSATYDHEHTPEYAAARLIKTLALALSTGELDLIAWYEISDLPPAAEVIGDVNNRHLGLLDADGSPKPALAAFDFAHELFAGPMRPIGDRVKVTKPAGSRAKVAAFERLDGSLVILAWLPTHHSAYDPLTPHGESVADERRETIALHLPGDPARATSHRPDGGEIDTRPVTAGRLDAVELRGGDVAIIVAR